MGLIRTVAIGALGYFGYKKYQEYQRDKNGVAFADGEADGAVRNAGPESMGDTARGEWDSTDQKMDESFPASDPPANY